MYIIGLLIGLVPLAAWAADEQVEKGKEQPMSEANTLLFLSDHLADIKQPSKLSYDFHKAGTMEEGFSDTIEMDITAIESDGTKDVQIHPFTGQRVLPFPDVPHAKGNPVLLLFLQRDVHEMQRLTEGNWRYFQRVMKLAFADGALVSPVTFDFGGKQVQGTKVRITPYFDDSHSGIAKYKYKYYEFTLSKAVPGWIYQLKSVVPENGDGSKILMEETITFQGMRSG